MKTIEEILELNKKRTQGDWSCSDTNKVCNQVDSDMDAICTDQFCYAVEKRANADFIAASPDMVHHIEELQQECDDYKEALEFYARGKHYSHVAAKKIIPCPTKFELEINDRGEVAQQALNKYKGKDNE